MNPLRRRLLSCLLLGAAVHRPGWAAVGTAPALMLAAVYRPGVPLADYWVSEKYDGVRGYWDGRQLLTRGGEVIAAPAWFTQGWPAEPMDGELWAGRGRFAQAASTVRRQVPDDEAWRAMRFMVFDLPANYAKKTMPKVSVVALDELIKAIQNLDASAFTKGGKGQMPFELTQVANIEVFAMYVVSALVIGPCGFNKKLHRGLSIRDVFVGTHFGFQQACWECKDAVQNITGVASDWPDKKDSDWVPVRVQQP